MYEHKEYLEEVRRVEPNDVEHVRWMLDKLDQYAKSGGKEFVGDFLQGIILGDLEGAVERADDTNKKYIALYVKYCYNQLPSELVMISRPVLDALRGFLFAERKYPLTRDQVRQATNAFAAKLEKIRGG